MDFGGDESSRVLPPGIERRTALLEQGQAVRLSDFTDEERQDLLKDLAELRSSLRARRPQ